MKSSAVSTLTGGLALWGFWVLVVAPLPGSAEWPLALVVFAILVTTLPTLELIRPVTTRARWLWSTAAVLSAVAAVLPPSIPGALLALPWLGLAGWTARRLGGQWLRVPRTLAGHLRVMAVFQLTIGAAWWVADRAGIDPFGFGALVGRLTAAHFHFAGGVLPVLAAETLEAAGEVRPLLRLAGGGVLVGVLAVAIGIAATRLGAPPWIETASAVALSASTLVVASEQFRQAWTHRHGWLLVSSASALVAMLFAASYAVRSWWPCPWLVLPRMWAWHGSLQVFGFACCGLLGRHLTRPRTRR